MLFEEVFFDGLLLRVGIEIFSLQIFSQIIIFSQGDVTLWEITPCLDVDDFMAEAMQRGLSCHSSGPIFMELSPVGETGGSPA